VQSSGPKLDIVMETVGSATVLSPKGDVDMARSPLMRKAIAEALRSGSSKVVLDFSGVPYMDSSGLATLVEALQNSRKSQIALSLCALTPRVRSILEIARLTSVFPIHDSRDAALAG
jgi:anti-sigma B factor antagonist